MKGVHGCHLSGVIVVPLVLDLIGKHEDRFGYDAVHLILRSEYILSAMTNGRPY